MPLLLDCSRQLSEAPTDARYIQRHKLPQDNCDLLRNLIRVEGRPPTLSHEHYISIPVNLVSASTQPALFLDGSSYSGLELCAVKYDPDSSSCYKANLLCIKWDSSSNVPCFRMMNTKNVKAINPLANEGLALCHDHGDHLRVDCEGLGYEFWAKIELCRSPTDHSICVVEHSQNDPRYLVVPHTDPHYIGTPLSK